MYFTQEDLAKFSVRTLYRLLTKNMQYYPSKNRFNIMMAMKEEFREHQHITDQKKIKQEIKKAKIGVAHIMLYKEKMEELNQNYCFKQSEQYDCLNPKDKEFIYF